MLQYAHGWGRANVQGFRASAGELEATPSDLRKRRRHQFGELNGVRTGPLYDRGKELLAFPHNGGALLGSDGVEGHGIHDDDAIARADVGRVDARLAQEFLVD